MEIKLIKSFNHPYVISLLDNFCENGYLYIVYQYFIGLVFTIDTLLVVLSIRFSEMVCFQMMMLEELLRKFFLVWLIFMNQV